MAVLCGDGVSSWGLMASAVETVRGLEANPRSKGGGIRARIPVDLIRCHGWVCFRALVLQQLLVWFQEHGTAETRIRG